MIDLSDAKAPPEVESSSGASKAPTAILKEVFDESKFRFNEKVDEDAVVVMDVDGGVDVVVVVVVDAAFEAVNVFTVDDAVKVVEVVVEPLVVDALPVGAMFQIDPKSRLKRVRELLLFFLVVSA